MTQETNISPYCKILNRNSRSTIVLFSALNYPKGKFSFYKFGLNSSSNIIFLNTFNNNWYYDGVPGLGQDVESSIGKLNEIINSFNSINVVFCGGSMGGGMPLLFGVHYQDFAQKLLHLVQN